MRQSFPFVASRIAQIPAGPRAFHPALPQRSRRPNVAKVPQTDRKIFLAFLRRL